MRSVEEQNGRGASSAILHRGGVGDSLIRPGPFEKIKLLFASFSEYEEREKGRKRGMEE